MLEETNRDLSGDLRAAVPFFRPAEWDDATPTAGRRPDPRPVRLGRAPAALDSAQESVPMVLSARSAEGSGGEPVRSDPGSARVTDVRADMTNRAYRGIDITKGFAELNTKFDAMKGSFDLLEAHVAVGLSRSIAETLRAEMSALEEQIALRHRYRARYKLALGVALLLAAAIVADQYRPFIDALFEPVRPVMTSAG
ncbi:MAG TPA: hypothetical protein VNS34_03275 [Rhizobiaceae bacterium]|nr:hypothetical protein [Rhizobiaceae bacterium]